MGYTVIITAYKGCSIVIMYKPEYINKSNEQLNEDTTSVQKKTVSTTNLPEIEQHECQKTYSNLTLVRANLTRVTSPPNSTPRRSPYLEK